MVLQIRPETKTAFVPKYFALLSYFLHICDKLVDGLAFLNTLYHKKPIAHDFCRKSHRLKHSTYNLM